MKAIVADRLGQAFNVRQGEAHIVLLLFAFSFLVGFANVYFETAAYAIFVSRWGVEELPFVYIGSAFLSIGIGAVYQRMESSVSFARLTILTLGFVAVVVVGLRISLASMQYLEPAYSRWPALILLMWSEVFYMLTGIMFWNMAGRLLNLRQGKRLFGLVSSGDVVASVIGGLSIGFLNQLFPTADQLYIVGLAFVACLFLTLYIARCYAEPLSNPEEDDEDDRITTRVKAGRQRYLLLLFGMVTLSIFAYYYLDYAFIDLLETKFRVCPGQETTVTEPGIGTGLGDAGCPPNAAGEQQRGYLDQESLAGFLGFFNAGVGLVNIIFKTLISGRLINRFGMTLGLLFLPVMVSIGILAAVLTDWVSGNLGVLIWVVVMVKLLDKVARESIDDSATVILYQPLPKDQRLRMQTIVESFAEPGATVFAGTTLLILTSDTVGFGASDLLFLVLLMILGAWIVTSVFLRKQYTLILSEALAKRTLGGGLLLINDASSLKVLEDKVRADNDNVGEVLYSLEMLEEANSKSLESKFEQCLDHPTLEVRLEALRRIERLGLSSLATPIMKLLAREKNPHIKGTALRTLAAFGEADIYDQLAPNLNALETEVRRGALVGLLRSGGIEGVLAAGQQLTNMTNSPDPQERRFAAEVLGDVGIHNFYRPLLDLFEDKDLDVQRSALLAAGKLDNAKLWPHLVKSLGVLKLRSVASQSLAHVGDDALADMKRAFQQEGQSRDVRIRILRICGTIRSRAAVEFLLEELDCSDSQVRHQVFRSLNRCHYMADNKSRDAVFQAIRREAINATWSLACLVDLNALSNDSLLLRSLTTQLNDCRERIFLLLAMYFNHHEIMQIKANYESGQGENRSYAVELLDNKMRQEIKELVIPLLEDIPHQQRLGRLAPIFNPQRLSFSERLKSLVMGGTEHTSFWTVSTALYEVALTEDSAYTSAITTALHSRDPIVVETTIWALGRLHPEDLASRLEPYTTHRHNNVAGMARFVIDTVALGTVTTRSPYLKRAGQHEVKQLARVLMNAEERPQRRRQIAKILAGHQGQLAFKALIDALYMDDKNVLAAVLDAFRLQRLDVSHRQTDLLQALGRELGDITFNLGAIRLLEETPGFQRLVAALQQSLTQSRSQVLKILALMGYEEGYHRLNYWYNVANDELPLTIITEAEETCELIPSRNLRQQTRVLFQGRSLNGEDWPVALDPPETVEELIVDLAMNQSRWHYPWIRVCALERLVNLQLSQYAAGVVEILRDPNDIVRDAAITSLAELAPAYAAEHLRQLWLDPSPLVADTVARIGRRLEKGASDSALLPAALLPGHHGK